MKDERTYSITVSHGLAILHVSWRGDDQDVLHNASFAIAVRELAKMKRSEAHMVIRERAQHYGIEQIPLHVEAALLVLALGEPPL